MYVFLVYDIYEEMENDRKAQKRLRLIFKLCKKYLHHIQKSVFEGEISKADLKILKQEIKSIIKKDVDSVIIIKTINENNLQKEFLGKKEEEYNFL